MRPHYLIILSLLLSASVSAFADFGGWNTIKHVGDRDIARIANYAVTEYNRQSGEHLKLVKVLSGQYQVVAGVNYRLVLSANYETGTNNCETIVYERAWEDFRDLIFFATLLRQ